MERLGHDINSTCLEDLVSSDQQIKEARSLAKAAHAGSKRFDGSDYFTHPEAVARILCEELGITDTTIIQAAYLHDIPEDTDFTVEHIRMRFGHEVAQLVDGMTKIRHKIRENGQTLSKEECDRLSEIKIFSDPRLGILKAAGDRLHNMRTLMYVPEKKRIPKAEETLIYAKLLESLGVWSVMVELEDLSLKYLDHNAYERYLQIIDTDLRTNNLFIENMVSGLKSIVPPEIKSEVTYKLSGLSRLKHKMERTPKVEDVNDLISFRIIVDENDEIEAANKCYKILRVLQEKYSQIEDQDRFDNFYFVPKINGYSALQITLNTNIGAVEIAITSKKKEEFNNWGVVSLIRNGETNLSRYSRVMVFTPKGKAKFLPQDATAIDFAYSISPVLGASATKAIINGEEKEMTNVLQTGQRIEIEHGEIRIAPDIRWATNPNYCSPETCEIIKQQLLDQERYKKIEEGKELAREIIQKRGIYDLIDIFSFDNLKDHLVQMLFHLGCKGSLDNLYFKIGGGYITTEQLDEQLNSFGLSKNNMNLKTLIIRGIDRIGVLEILGQKVKESKGNIGALNQERHITQEQALFELRLVIENLDQKSANDLVNSVKHQNFVINAEIF